MPSADDLSTILQNNGIFGVILITLIGSVSFLFRYVIRSYNRDRKEWKEAIEHANERIEKRDEIAVELVSAFKGITKIHEESMGALGAHLHNLTINLEDMRHDTNYRLENIEKAVGLDAVEPKIVNKRRRS